MRDGPGTGSLFVYLVCLSWTALEKRLWWCKDPLATALGIGRLRRDPYKMALQSNRWVPSSSFISWVYGQHSHLHHNVGFWWQYMCRCTWLWNMSIFILKLIFQKGTPTHIWNPPGLPTWRFHDWRLLVTHTCGTGRRDVQGDVTGPWRHPLLSS